MIVMNSSDKQKLKNATNENKSIAHPKTKCIV